MIIDCISDLHGFYPELEGGDFLIVAGDLTEHDLPHDRLLFLEWLANQNYRKKLWIAGNHDNSLVGCSFKKTGKNVAEYLCDSGTEFEGLKIWGSPWTKSFEGMNPKCKAFVLDTEEELKEKWKLIPNDIDILITHSPPYGIKDRAIREKSNFGYECVGSRSLQMQLFTRLCPKLHVFGHIHEDNGIDFPNGDGRIRVNASYVNEHYQPVNKPIRIEL